MMRLSAAAGLFLLATTSMASAQESPAFDFNVITEEAPAPVTLEEGDEEVGKITVSPPPGTVNVTEEVKKAAEEEVAEETSKEIIWAETPPEAAEPPVEEPVEQVKEEPKEPPQQEGAPAVTAAPEPEAVVAPAPATPKPVISVVPVAPTAAVSPTPQSWQSPAARTTSPYERNRVVPRIELDGSLPQPKIGAPFTALGHQPAAAMPAPAPATAPAPVMAAAPSVGMQPVYEQPATPSTPPAPATPQPEPKIAEPVAPVQPSTVDAPAASSPATPALPSAAAVTLAFESNKSELTADMLMQVDQLIAQMAQNPALRLQVRAFATASDNSEMTAKRVALSRVLAVRSYMLEKGIAPLRIDVRPLGLDAADRVELEFID